MYLIVKRLNKIHINMFITIEIYRHKWCTMAYITMMLVQR
ncbi:hypothetical protein SPAB_01032 [Salmonella enterica subsp. enterica serovar Paratyphi B str. SPB7]|uniref:Uncharacterized protein n=1 Tax=Salmonella paratyphi B (strain ATCC BAA-1250 / SPB7) TaxID=1016998 RepID=A0A6C6YZL3_SALPB|nr:hypothetical protein SPAB_01032 [Salmonella enterica subsp. enterica serovar Paratyphi B str. SPB7]